MLNKIDYFYPCNITVITNNNELIKEVNEFGKKIELEHIEDKKRNPHMYDELLSDSYYTVNTNNDKSAQLVIVANDIDKYILDREKYNIQFHNGNKIDGFDSYICCENYKEAIIDMLKLAYEFGLICVDIDDIIKFINDKNFNYYRYILDSPISTNKINELVNVNKNCIAILYGSKNLSLIEVDKFIDTFKNKGNYFGAKIDDNISEDKRVLAVFIEE